LIFYILLYNNQLTIINDRNFIIKKHPCLRDDPRRHKNEFWNGKHEFFWSINEILMKNDCIVLLLLVNLKMIENDWCYEVEFIVFKLSLTKLIIIWVFLCFVDGFPR
jgi:hypothetical protein